MATLNLVGSSAKFRALLDNVDLVAPVDSAVLIQGETGTGKEVIARAIHEAEPSPQEPFCSAQLCGHSECSAGERALRLRKRSFHRRVRIKPSGDSRWRIGERSFLTRLETCRWSFNRNFCALFKRSNLSVLAAIRHVQIDVRVIAATNQDLGQMVRERRFRADLYYRLNVFPMTLPPLRERRDDIALLTEYFVRKFAGQQGKVVATIPRDVMAALEHYDWPGNIRELQNVIERGVIMTTGSVLSRQTTELLTTGEAVPARFPAAAEPTSIRTMADAERAHITATLRATNWVVGGPNGAAAQLGLPRTTLMSRMQRLGISNLSRRRSGRSIERFVRVMGGLSSRLKDESSAGLRVMEAVAG